MSRKLFDFIPLRVDIHAFGDEVPEMQRHRCGKSPCDSRCKFVQRQLTDLMHPEELALELYAAYWREEAKWARRWLQSALTLLLEQHTLRFGKFPSSPRPMSHGQLYAFWEVLDGFSSGRYQRNGVANIFPRELERALCGVESDSSHPQTRVSPDDRSPLSKPSQAKSASRPSPAKIPETSSKSMNEELDKFMKAHPGCKLEPANKAGGSTAKPLTPKQTTEASKKSAKVEDYDDYSDEEAAWAAHRKRMSYDTRKSEKHDTKKPEKPDMKKPEKPDTKKPSKKPEDEDVAGRGTHRQRIGHNNATTNGDHATYPGHEGCAGYADFGGYVDNGEYGDYGSYDDYANAALAAQMGGMRLIPVFNVGPAPRERRP